MIRGKVRRVKSGFFKYQLPEVCGFGRIKNVDGVVTSVFSDEYFPSRGVVDESSD